MSAVEVFNTIILPMLVAGLTSAGIWGFASVIVKAKADKAKTAAEAKKTTAEAESVAFATVERVNSMLAVKDQAIEGLQKQINDFYTKTRELTDDIAKLSDDVLNLKEDKKRLEQEKEQERIKYETELSKMRTRIKKLEDTLTANNIQIPVNGEGGTHVNK